MMKMNWKKTVGMLAGMAVLALDLILSATVGFGGVGDGAFLVVSAGSGAIFFF